MVFAAIAGGHEELLRDCLQARGARALPELADSIYEVVLATFGADDRPRRASRKTKSR